MKLLMAALVALLVGCSRDRACDEANGFRHLRDVCAISRTADVIARGAVVKVGRTRAQLFSLWPDTPLAVTPITIEVDRSVRGPTGRLEALISLRTSPDGKLLRSQTPAQTSGWFEAAQLDGELFVSCDARDRRRCDRARHDRATGVLVGR